MDILFETLTRVSPLTIKNGFTLYLKECLKHYSIFVGKIENFVQTVQKSVGFFKGKNLT